MPYAPCRSCVFLHVPTLIDIISTRQETGHLSAHLFPLGGIIWPSFPATDFHRACKNFITMETLLSWHLFRIGWSYSLASKVMGQGRYWPPILWKPRWWVTLTMSIFFRNIQHLSAFFYCENRFIFFSLKEHQKCQLKLAAVRLWHAFSRH